MKVIAGLVAVTVAGPVGLDRGNTQWPANPDAPHCGCQFNLDPKEEGQMWNYINSTCRLSFTYPGETSGSLHKDPHFVSVASSYMIGRDHNEDSGLPSEFQFTGYDEVSNPDLLDILVFFEKEDCIREGMNYADLLADIVPQDEIYQYYNMTTEQVDTMCNFELVCDGDGNAVPGVHLGNFNYDIARSVQTYTVPIYGLEKNKQAIFPIRDYYNNDFTCMLPKAHEGHGTASGCSTPRMIGGNNSSAPFYDGDCSNVLTFDHDKDHNGLLEYFEFQPVSPVNAPDCFNLPLHKLDDYKWNVPSPWDTQNAYDELN